jgi:ketosteroid isomerase-like protein
VAVSVREIVHQFVGAMNRREIAAVMELLAPDAVLDAGPRFRSPYVGREAIRAMFEAYLTAMPELVLIVREVHVNRTQAVATIDLVATMSEMNPGEAQITNWPAKRRLGWRGAYHFTLSNDALIQQIVIFGDDSGTRWLPDLGHSTGKH